MESWEETESANVAGARRRCAHNIRSKTRDWVTIEEEKLSNEKNCNRRCEAKEKHKPKQDEKVGKSRETVGKRER